jgi:hypothetical protein
MPKEVDIAVQVLLDTKARTYPRNNLKRSLRRLGLVPAFVNEVRARGWNEPYEAFVSAVRDAVAVERLERIIRRGEQ